MGNILVTGGAGFIGSAFIRKKPRASRIVNLDCLSYAADLKRIVPDGGYRLVVGDVRDAGLVEAICLEEKIDTIVHFAAETHVDRSIKEPLFFLDVNGRGTGCILEVVRRHPEIHFHGISTDEVFGEGSFTLDSPYLPNSPYAASKAAADHLVRAYARTYGISTSLSYCTNNFGPGQHSEKLIPKLIGCCLRGESMPLYGDGEQVRDWIYVDDHVEALWKIVMRRERNGRYMISARQELTNRQVADAIARVCGGGEVAFIADRPGHDRRYALDPTETERELNWKARHPFEEALAMTVEHLKREAF